MPTSTINIEVQLDNNRVCEEILWKASDSSAEKTTGKSHDDFFWDAADKTALRIDLWTKDMMVDEMADFYYQTMITMADTFSRATRQQELTADLKTFAKNFYEKFRNAQVKENTL